MGKKKKKREIYSYVEQDYKGCASLKSHRKKLNRCLGLKLTLYTEDFNLRLQNGSGGEKGLFFPNIKSHMNTSCLDK